LAVDCPRTLYLDVFGLVHPEPQGLTGLKRLGALASVYVHQPSRE
jgi:hypothetical protein